MVGLLWIAVGDWISWFFEDQWLPCVDLRELPGGTSAPNQTSYPLQACRVSPRRATYFSLLRQRNLRKRKATRILGRYAVP